MTNENVVRQLKDLKSEAEYQLRYDPDNDVWIDDYNALDLAIKAVENKKDNLGFWVGFGFCSLFWLLIYFLYHL